MLTSDSVLVSVITPQILSTNDATRCGNGSVTLTATSNAGANIYWFSSNTPTNPIGSGPTLVTPYLSNTTTYYVGAFVGTPQSSPVCGSTLTPVNAIINNAPEVNLGNDINKCVEEGHIEFLNARNPGLNYLWDNGYNGQVRTVDKSGVYWVYVSNNNGCGTTDTIKVTFKPNPISALGKDTTVCIGSTIKLDAGNDGIQYMWSNGATSSTTTVNAPDWYKVIITGANGCINSDSIKVTHQGSLPQHDGIYVRNKSSNTFQFSLLNSQFSQSLAWDFGDGSPISYEPTPTHTYPIIGNYVVSVVNSSTCGSIKDTTTIHILSTTNIDNVDWANDLKIFPNPISNKESITVSGPFHIHSVSLLAINGAVLKTAINDTNPSSISMNLETLPDGMYYLLIDTDAGKVIKKLNILSN